MTRSSDSIRRDIQDLLREKGVESDVTASGGIFASFFQTASTSGLSRAGIERVFSDAAINYDLKRGGVLVSPYEVSLMAARGWHPERK